MFAQVEMRFHSEPHDTKLPPREGGGEGVAGLLARPQPVSFSGCRGLLHWAPGATGIVLCSPWGYEELVVRHGWRTLAENLAAAGFPCLRFDYPGTADSLGELADFSLPDWIEATRRSCEILRQAGARRLVLLGQSIGCLIACKAALDQPDIDGLVLLAPAQGRRYLREQAVWSSMLAQVEGHSAKSEDGSTAIAGFVLPSNFATEIKTLTVTGKPAPWALLVEAQGRADTAFTEKLSGFGVNTEHIVFDGLDELVGDPTTSRVPQRTYAKIVEILRQRYNENRPFVGPGHAVLEPDNLLVTPAYSEEAIYFGPSASLFGLLCLPKAAAKPAAVLFLNTGRNAHIGWSRMTVGHARRLAKAGIASFRIDVAGVGESPSRADRSAEFLYSEAPVRDVVAAVDILAARGFTSISLVGVCSGAYLGLLGALGDQRVTGLVSINSPRFVWGKSESIEAAIRFLNRPNAQSFKRVFDFQTLRLILTGKLNPRAAIEVRLKSNIRRIGLKFAPFIGPLSPSWQIYRDAKQRLTILRARGVKIFLGFGANDEGFAELQLLFGEQGRRLASYPNIELGFTENIDHNLSQPHARDWLFAAILKNLGLQH
jgi:alpha-beta hydrolase superfamily lysophospholipase